MSVGDYLMQIMLLFDVSSGAVKEGQVSVDYGSIGIADEKRAKEDEGKDSMASGIEVELSVELLSSSLPKVVVVVRSKQKLARSQHSRTRKPWCAFANFSA
jgi:hypothetical protein